ncbi:MAG: sigma 54-interacting transcriptional regulator [Myxococcota bacterium]
MPVDDIRTGTWITRVDGRPSSLEIRRCRLTVLAGPDAGQSVELARSRVRVGAVEGCDLILSDPRVSRHHFEIQLDDEGYRLRDLDSTNGTFVAGHRVRDVYLNPSSSIYVGDSRLRFEPLDTSVSVKLSERERFGRMVGRSVAMRALFAKLERIAPTDASLLVTGETGTGKELVAEAVHYNSPRKDGPFEVLDCGSVAENLIASELFGHERGAFTGAHTMRIGAFEEASGGTVFLDEIGEMPVELQSKLLSVLENREIRRLGSNTARPVDVRIIAATNRDLRAEVNAGRFREDLYYRLAVVNVKMPPLRQRLEDLPDLARRLFERQGLAESRIAELMTPEFQAALARSAWPGNIRELRNYLEQYLIFEDLVPDDSDAELSESAAAQDIESGSNVQIDASQPFSDARQQVLKDFERLYVTELLRAHDGKVSRAANTAGITRTYLYRLLQRHKLTGKSQDSE